MRLLRYPVDIMFETRLARSGGAGSYIRTAVTPVVPRLGEYSEREREKEKMKKRKRNFKTSRRVGRTGVISTLVACLLACLLVRLRGVCTRLYTYVHKTCIPNHGKEELGEHFN